MSLSLPQFTLSQKPNGFSPVNAPIWFAFTASFASSSGDINNSEAFIDLQIIDQNNEAGSIIDSPGRFKVPPRGNTYVYDPSNVLKTYVTFPFDSSTAYMSVNEWTGFGATAGSYPFIAPETEGIVRYQLHYGLQWNPNVTFQDLASVTGLAGGNTIYASIGVNYFCAVGDVISITLDSDLFRYFAGTASVLSIGDSGFDTFVTTDQIVDADALALILAAGGTITGEFTNVQHFYGTASYYYGTNGTKQWFEQDIDYGNRYALQGNQPFLTDYGYDSNHCIPIKPGQAERARFIADFYGDSGYTLDVSSGMYFYTETFDSNMVFLGTSSVLVDTNDPITGAFYSQKCFTICVFDNFNTIPIVDGYYYKFSIKVMSSHGHLNPFPPIWYRGDTKCSKYDNYRIKFLNKQGSWNYWNFNKDTTKTTTIERTEYTRPTQYNYTLLTDRNNYSTSKLRGTAVLSSKAEQTFTMNTDWITEDSFTFLSQLVTSPEVFIYYDYFSAYVLMAELALSGYNVGNTIFGIESKGTNIPIIITDTSYVYKTLNRDKLFNLTITFKYAFDTNLQYQ